MTEVAHRDVAIVGMACSFPAAGSLTRFWQGLMNDTLQAESPSAAREPDAEALLHETIRQALIDSGGTPDSPVPHPLHLVFAREQSAPGSRPTPDLAAEWGAAISRISAAAMSSLEVLTLAADILRDAPGKTVVIAARHQDGGDAGCVAVVLRRRSDAEADGDCVYAFIKGVAIANDENHTAPLVEALGTPDQIGFLEIPGCRFTADETSRMTAVERLFGCHRAEQMRRPMGSLNGVRGCAATTLGLAALVKAALSLSNKMLPPSGCPAPRDGAWERLPFYLNIDARPWIHDISLPPRRAFLLVDGTPGRAVHVVLEELSVAAARTARPRPIRPGLHWDSEVVVVSAETPAAMVAHVERLHGFLRHAPDVRLVDVAYTQHQRFVPEHRCRLAIVCATVAELREHLQVCGRRLQDAAPDFEDVKAISYSPNGQEAVGKIAWVFPGLGFPGLMGPYAEHLMELCLRFPDVREVFDRVDRRAGETRDPIPTHQICFPPAAFPEAERQQLQQRLASPRLVHTGNLDIAAEGNLSPFGVSVANWASRCVLDKLAVPVDMTFGQSYGDLTALCAAGALDFDDLVAVHWEVRLTPEHFVDRGRLALAGIDEQGVQPLLERFTDLSIAIHLAPRLLILGGDADQLAAVMEELQAIQVWTQLLPYPAIHTPRFTSLYPSLEPSLKRLALAPCRVPVYTGMLATTYPEDTDGIRELVIANLDRPVLLWQTTQQMYRDGARIFLQMNDGATIASQASHGVGADDMTVVTLNVDHRSATEQLNHLCATLLTLGVDLDLDYLYAYRSPERLNIDDAPAVEASDSLNGRMRSPVAKRDGTPRLPFVGRVLHHVEQQELVTEQCLDLQEHRFLSDHLFVHAEGVRPIAARLPVLPLTMGMEMMAEAASHLAPGYGLLGFEGVRARRWIALEDSETLLLRVSAQLDRRDDARGTRSIAVTVQVAGRDVSAMQSTVLLGRRYSTPMTMDFESPRQPRVYPLDAAQIYDERRLFHGPTFRCISGRPILAERAVMGELAILPKDGMFGSTDRPPLLTDPVILDGVGQLVGLWAMEREGYVFPIAVSNLEIYGPTPPVGVRVPVYIEITEFSDKLLYANAEVQNGDGLVWMRLKGWGTWVFRWARHAFDFRRFPTRYCLSRSVDAPALPAGAVCQVVSDADLRDHDQRAIARFYLHEDEMRAFNALPVAGDARQQWLLDRIAAKDAARRWLLRPGDREMLHPAALALSRDAGGGFVLDQAPLHGATPPVVRTAQVDDGVVAVAHSTPVGMDFAPVLEAEQLHATA